MSNGIILYPECEIDTLLTVIIGERYGLRRNKEIWHVRGTGLFNSMKENNNARIAAGFFDINKKLHQVVTFKDYNEVASSNSVRLLRHNRLSHKHLFFVTIGVEEWILDAAATAGIYPKEYNLPDELNEFATISKRQNLSNNQDMRRFLKALVTAEPPHIQTLEEYVSTTFNLERKW